MQTRRRKGQFFFLLTISPRLYAFQTKEYLTAGSTPITAILAIAILVPACDIQNEETSLGDSEMNLLA